MKSEARYRPSGRGVKLGKRGRWVVLVLACLGAPLVVEIGLRGLLFAELGPTRSWRRTLRDPGRYADPRDQDEYWKLRYLWSERRGERARPPYDELLGWRSRRLEAGTYAHPDEAFVGVRRPVLLYGASMAEGLTPREARFEALLESSTLSQEFALVNYGTGGYGIAQALLLLRETLDRWEGRQPLVLLGLCIESDFDRAALSLRSWPKPWVEWVDGQLSWHAPPGRDAEECVERQGIGIGSYAWRHLIYGTRILPSGVSRRLRREALREDRRRALRGALLAEFARELDARGVPWALLAMHARASLEAAPDGGPMEAWLSDSCARLGIELLGTREPLIEAARAADAPVAEFYYTRGAGRNHLNEGGHTIAFDAIRGWLERADPVAADSAR